MVCGLISAHSVVLLAQDAGGDVATVVVESSIVIFQDIPLVFFPNVFLYYVIRQQFLGLIISIVVVRVVRGLDVACSPSLEAEIMGHLVSPYH